MRADKRRFSMMNSLALSLLPDVWAICRFPPDAAIPAWALTGEFVSITRTADELSIVCAQAHVPSDVQCDPDWRCFKIEGPLDLSLVGILAALTAPLAQAGIGVFAVSTYDTDYLMIKAGNVDKAVAALSQAGYRFKPFGLAQT